MISKAFSAREKALLIVLVIVLVFAVYYLAVFVPTSNTMGAAREEIAKISDIMKIEQVKAEQIRKMRDALKEISDSVKEKAVTPAYDNFQPLLDVLNAALVPTESYKLNFLVPKIEDGIAKRELQLLFNSDNYFAAQRVISELYSGPFRNDITSFRLIPTEKASNDLTADPVTAELSIVYYELAKDIDIASE